MATKVHRGLVQIPTSECAPRLCVNGDPALHKSLRTSSHVILQVQDSISLTPKSFSVNVINGSKGMKVPVEVKSTDTIGKMLQKVLKLEPDLVESLNLIYNGKPVQLEQSLCNLQVRPGATFITYQKCYGG